MPDEPVNSAAYYDQHSKRYIGDTESVDMSAIHARFLAHLPAKARILDAGCGSGRDSLAFKRLGHEVTAYDASAAMAQHASQALGQDVLHLRHEEIDFVEAFDGIWSNASLLHVAQIDLPNAFGKLHRALVSGGILFTSFKLGEGGTIAVSGSSAIRPTPRSGRWSTRCPASISWKPGSATTSAPAASTNNGSTPCAAGPRTAGSPALRWAGSASPRSRRRPHPAKPMCESERADRLIAHQA